MVSFWIIFFSLVPNYFDGIAQLVPGTIRGGAKPQTGRASRSKAAAKAVRTATKLSHRVTERYDAGY